MKEKCSVLFWFPIDHMSHSSETKIQVVILMAKHESRVMVIRELLIIELEQQLSLSPPSKLL